MSAPATDIRDGAFLAIWSDVAPEIETDYLHWLTREHTQERLSVPGFLGVRVFRALHVPMCRYFILYALRDEAVVASPAYLARLNAPTPWTQRIMPQLQNFARAGGRKVAQFGSGAGGYAIAVPLATPLSVALREKAAQLAEIDRVVAVRLFETDAARTEIRTNEKSIRGGDASCASLLLVEALDEDTLATAWSALRPALPSMASDEAPVYLAVFALNAAALDGSNAEQFSLDMRACGKPTKRAPAAACAQGEPMSSDFPVLDPNNVPETLAAGLINFATQGPLAVLTFTHTRAAIAELVAGKENPAHAFYVVARLAMPLATARDLRDLLNRVITDNETEPASASTGTKH